MADNKETLDVALDAIMRHEGFMAKPYRCPAKYLSIGFGRNLDTKGITKAEAKMLALNDIVCAITFLNNCFSSWEKFSLNRQLALVDMVFNLGEGGFLKFKNMLAKINVGDWAGAADEAKDSLWFKQVGKRAVEDVNLLREG
jgi:lysozyme